MALAQADNNPTPNRAYKTLTGSNKWSELQILQKDALNVVTEEL